MVETGGTNGQGEPAGTRLPLDLWHPNCRAIEGALGGVREDAGAEVSVEAVTTASTGRSGRDHRTGSLTPAQREAFEHAREAGYYRWPREASTRELAEAKLL